MLFALVVFIILLVFFFLEAEKHKKNVNNIPIRILVNGTRGKSTISRLLVASLNNSGIRTVGRSTGSEAQLILPDGSVEMIVRKRGARIYELIDFFKRANAEKAECVVVECMALMSENQIAFRDKLVCPTDVIISNTYVDHVPEMGFDVLSTSKVLSLSIPKHANLFVTESLYDNCCDNVIHVDTSSLDENKKVHPISIAICKAFLSSKNIALSCLDKAIEQFIPDKGLLSEMNVGSNSLFVPTFSVNDLTVMEETIKKWKNLYPQKKFYVVFNNREDREYRILLFKDVLTREKNNIDKVFVIGDYKKKVARILSKISTCQAIEITNLASLIKESDNSMYIGLGNIKGDGEKLLDILS